MILHPLSPQALPAGVVPAWSAVAASQKQGATAWWLIAQPDHAALAGELAARLAGPDFPPLDREPLRAISLHDSGWARFDGGGEAGGGQGTAPPPPLRAASGRPLSFLDAAVSVFVEAWADSIQCAEEKAGAIGGLMVSGHFRRLAQHRLDTVEDAPADAARIRAFLGEESRREEARLRGQPRSPAEVERLVDVLQLCDLLSLYLCCGSQASVQFPQTFGVRPIVARRAGEMWRMEPPLLAEGVSLGVPARRDPVSTTEPNSCMLPVLLR